MTKGVFAVLSVLIVVVVLLLMVQRLLNPCYDDTLGYEREIKASLDIARSNMRGINVGVNDVDRIQTELQHLAPGDFAALRALNSQCRLLSRCVFLSFQRSAAKACPTEYEDYLASVREVLPVLSGTKSLAQATSEARANADGYSEATDDLDELRDSAGATGGRRAVLLQRVQLAETAFSDSLGDVQVLIEELSARTLNQE